MIKYNIIKAPCSVINNDVMFSSALVYIETLDNSLIISRTRDSVRLGRNTLELKNPSFTGIRREK